MSAVLDRLEMGALLLSLLFLSSSAAASLSVSPKSFSLHLVSGHDYTFPVNVEWSGSMRVNATLNTMVQAEETNSKGVTVGYTPEKIALSKGESGKISVKIDTHFGLVPDKFRFRIRPVIEKRLGAGKNYFRMGKVELELYGNNTVQIGRAFHAGNGLNYISGVHLEADNVKGVIRFNHQKNMDVEIYRYASGDWKKAKSATENGVTTTQIVGGTDYVAVNASSRTEIKQHAGAKSRDTASPKNMSRVKTGPKNSGSVSEGVGLSREISQNNNDPDSDHNITKEENISEITRKEYSGTTGKFGSYPGSIGQVIVVVMTVILTAVLFRR